MFIPVIGIVLATMIGAVTATIAMEKLAPEMPMPKAAAEELV
jgi:ABC-type enterochelin transport system permease subunit